MVAEKVRESGMTIGEVARQVGIATSAIRYYEEIGLLPPPARVNGRRRYDWSAVQRLCVIEYAQQAGFTLAASHDFLPRQHFLVYRVKT